MKKLTIWAILMFLFIFSMANVIADSNLSEENFTFKGVREVEGSIMYYTQNNLLCPNRDPTPNEIKSKLRGWSHNISRYSDTQINNMIIECKNGKEGFTIKLADRTPLADCMNKINNTIKENQRVVTIVNQQKYEHDLIVECVIQEEFKERYASEIRNNTDFFENLLKKRTESAVSVIKLKNAAHERTEADDEEAYLQRIEKEKRETNASSFDPNANYSLGTFPVYDAEPTENFLQRFSNYFKRVFDLSEWHSMLFQKKERRLAENK